MWLPKDSSTLKEVGNSYTWVIFHFWARKWSDVRVLIERPSPRLGHGASPGRKGSPLR